MYQSVEDVLKTFSNDVRKYDNGCYYAQMNNGNEIFVPADIDNNISLLAYAPGSGGSVYDANKFRNLYKSDYPPSCVTVVSSSCSDNFNILDIGTNVINGIGSNVDNALYASFSASGIKGIERGSKYIENHPEVSLSILSCDGCGSYDFMTDARLKNEFTSLRDNNVPITIIQGYNYPDPYNRLMENGYNAFLLTPDSSRRLHGITNQDMIDYLLFYALGEVDEIPEGANYASFTQNGEDVDMENLRCDGANFIEGYDKNKYKDILKVGNISLSNLDKFRDDEKIGNGYLKSDFQFLTNSMNSIRKTVSKSNIATKTPTLPIAGIGSLLSCISSCISKYSDMTVMLYDKINQETTATTSYAQAIIDMDLYQRGLLDEISNPVLLDTGIGSLSNSISNAISISVATGIALNESTNNNSVISNNNDNVLVNNNVSNNGSNDSTVNNSNNSNYSSGENIVYNQAIADGLTTFKYDDGHKLEVNVEDGKVTSMKFSYTFDSKEKLDANIDKILVGEIDKEYFDKVDIIDNTVEITIKKDFFESLSLDKIKELFFKGGNISE